MKLRDLIKIRTKAKVTPRLENRTIAPRVTGELEEKIQPTFEKALDDYKEHYSEVVPEVMKKYGHEPLEGPPFPEGEPELRVVDRIMGSEGLEGMNLVERLNGVHSVVNISDAVARDVYMVSLHELFHNSLSQRGIDLGDKEESMADLAAEKIARRSDR